MGKQGAFTAVAEVAEGRLDALRAQLVRVQLVDKPGCPIAFGDLQTVHFMRWVILEPGEDAAGRKYPPYLVLSTNFDEPLGAHLAELVRVAGVEFDNIYSCCVGFDPAMDRVRYLTDHSVCYEAFYIGTRNRTVGQIRREKRLRDDIEAYLDSTPGLPTKPDELCAHLRARFTAGDYAWVKGPDFAPPDGVPPVAVPAKTISAVAALALVAAWVASLMFLDWPWWLVPAVALGAAALFLAALRLYETFEPRPVVPHTEAGVGVLTSHEDFVVQNQLTHFVPVKPYIFRRLTLRVVLRVINLFGRLVFVRGALGGIPSIHFARWVLLDRGRRLLFMSNFDGSWENYLGDFIDKAAVGLTAVWSNTVDCPPARFLVLAGARDERAFKEWTRRHQLETQVWYSAYRDLSVENINNNTKIRQGLAAPLTGDRARDWLALL